MRTTLWAAMLAAAPIVTMGVPGAIPGTVGSARAAEPVVLTLEGNHFTPATLDVPAGQRFRIEIHNKDATPAEFESSDLRVEKIVVPGGKIAVFAGPLRAGRYAFFDDYHPDTAKGMLTAVEAKAAE